MLTKENYTKENIIRLQKMSGNDPSMLEKTVFAFGLLEAITKVGMPFIFKGGTCLMLLLDKPRRLSTDIDIIVEPGTDVDKYIQEAGKLFPFISQKEDIRTGRNNIEKRHYEFTYESPINDKPLVILLDILFEKNNYENVIQKEIANDILLTEDKNLFVKLPDVNSILGDKMTAFAPHTTGVKFGVGKELEVIKQLFDCYTLIQVMDDYKGTAAVYHRVAETELDYRGLDISIKQVLIDTISSCFCIISKGAINKADYANFAEGIRRIGGHIYSGKFNGDVAAFIACEVLYFATCLYTESDFSKIEKPEYYLKEKLSFKGARGVNYLRKVNAEGYAYLVAASKLLGDEVEDIVYCYEK